MCGKTHMLFFRSADDKYTDLIKLSGTARNITEERLHVLDCLR